MQTNGGSSSNTEMCGASSARSLKIAIFLKFHLDINKYEYK